MSDEIYGLLTFDGRESRSTAYLAGDVPVIVLNGMAKVFQRTGWGVGYVCFHDPEGKIIEVKKAAKRVARLYGHYTRRMSTPIIYAAAKAFEGNLDATKEMMMKLRYQRDYTMKRFDEIDGISCFKPEAALYTFPRVEGIGTTWKTDDDFIFDMIKEERVRFTTGNHFGNSGKGHFRALLLPDMEILKEVYNRLERFMKRHRR